MCNYITHLYRVSESVISDDGINHLLGFEVISENINNQVVHRF